MTITVTEVERASYNKFWIKVVSDKLLGLGTILESDSMKLTIIDFDANRFCVKAHYIDRPAEEVKDPRGVYEIATTLVPVRLGSIENVKFDPTNTKVTGLYYPSRLYKTPESFTGLKLIAKLPKPQLTAYENVEPEVSTMNIQQGSLNKNVLTLKVENPSGYSVDPSSFFYIYGIAQKTIPVFKRGVVKASLKVGYFVDADKYHEVDVKGEGITVLPRNPLSEPEIPEWSEVDYDELDEQPEEGEEPAPEKVPKETGEGIPDEFIELGRFECSRVEGFLVEGLLNYSGNVGRNTLTFLEKVEAGKRILLKITTSSSISKAKRGKAAKSSSKAYRFAVNVLQGTIELGTYSYSRGVVPIPEVTLGIVKLPKAPEGLATEVYGAGSVPVLVLTKGPSYFDKPRLFKEGHKETFNASVYGFYEPARSGLSKLRGENVPQRHPLAIEGEAFLTRSSNPKKSLFETGIDFEESKLLAERMVREWERTQEGIYDVKSLAKQIGKQRRDTSPSERQKMAEELAIQLSKEIIDDKKRFIKAQDPVIARRLREKRAKIFMLFCCASFLAKEYFGKEARYENVKGLIDFVQKEPEWTSIRPFCGSLNEATAYAKLREKIPELRAYAPVKSTQEQHSMILSAIENAFFDQVAVWEEGSRRIGKVLKRTGPSIIVKDSESGVERVILTEKQGVKNLRYYPVKGENVIIDEKKVGTFIGFASSMNYMYIKVGPSILAYPSTYDGFEWMQTLSEEAKDNYGSLDKVTNALVSYFVHAFTTYYGIKEGEVSGESSALELIEKLPEISEKLTLPALEADLNSYVKGLPKNIQTHMKAKNTGGAKYSLEDLAKVVPIKGKAAAENVLRIVNNAVGIGVNVVAKKDYNDQEQYKKDKREEYNTRGLLRKIIDRFEITLLQRVKDYVSDSYKLKHLEPVLSKLPKYATLKDIENALKNTIRTREKSLIEKVREFVAIWRDQKGMSSKELLVSASTAGVFIGDLFKDYENYFKKKIQTGEYPIENVPYFSPAHYLPEFFATKYLDDDNALGAMMSLINDARTVFINKIREGVTRSVYTVISTSVSDDLELGMRARSYADDWFRDVDMQCFDTNPEFTENDPANIVMCKEKNAIVCYSVPKLIASIYGDGKNPNDPSKKLSKEFIERMKARYPQGWLSRLPASPTGILIPRKTSVKSHTVGEVVKALYEDETGRKGVVGGGRGNAFKSTEYIKYGGPASELRKDIDEHRLLEKLRQKYPRSLLKTETAKTVNESEFRHRESCLDRNDEPYVVKGVHLIGVDRKDVMKPQTLKFHVKKGYREIKVGSGENFEKVLVIMDTMLKSLKDAPKEFIRGFNQIVYIGKVFKTSEEFLKQAQKDMIHTFDNNRYHFYSGTPNPDFYYKVIRDLLWCIEGTPTLDEPDPKFSKGYSHADKWTPRLLELSKVKSTTVIKETQIEEEKIKKGRKNIPEPVFEPSSESESEEDYE